MTWVPKNRATDGEDDESNGLGDENEKGKTAIGVFGRFLSQLSFDKEV